MKIAYYARVDTNEESGILKKIVGQIKAWQKEGHEVKLFAISKHPQRWEGLQRIDSLALCFPGKWTRAFGAKEMNARIKAWDPGVIYLRHQIYYPFMDSIMIHYPTFVEVQTNEDAEFRTIFSLQKRFYHHLTKNIYYRKAKGIVCMTHEIADRFRTASKPVCVIGNGIDLGQYPETMVPRNVNPRIVFIGSANQMWNGIDKVIWLAARFPAWNFDVIGTDEITNRQEISSNIKMHGFLSRNEYEPIMMNADAAIGTLSLYGKAMEEACPLKVREYLAYGLPVIMGYKDTDFPNSAPFILQLPNIENNVKDNCPAIVEFLQKWKGQRVSRHLISHLDNAIKEKQRLSFISAACF
jgi:glycosyltransferase involved in cell wall biosynthesis